MGKPEKITIQIKIEGEDFEFETHILPFSYATAVAQMQAYGENKEALAGVLASVICDEKGKLEFNEKEIREQFNQAFVDLIWNKIVEINMLGKKPSLVQTTNSSSKSELSAEKVIVKSKSSRSQKSKNTQVMLKNTEAST